MYGKTFLSEAEASGSEFAGEIAEEYNVCE